MPKTWENYECRFWTENDVNRAGNSCYTVTADSFQRLAPLNYKRAPEQADNVEMKAICYFFDDGSDLSLENAQNKIEIAIQLAQSRSFAPPHRAPDITIVNVEGDRIRVRVRIGHNALEGEVSRTPEVGWCAFDFVNNDGKLSHIHIGHPIVRLDGTPLSPEVRNLDRNMFQLKMINAEDADAEDENIVLDLENKSGRFSLKHVDAPDRSGVPKWAQEG